jgi:purine-binding chemotaxis protein CheW
MGGMLGLLAFTVAGRRLALDLAVVDRVVPMVAVTPLAGAPPGVLGAIDVAGEIVPVLDVRRRLDLPPRAPHPEDRLVLARTPRRPVAVPADEVLGVREPVAPPAADELVRGVVGLPDGLLLIADLDTFLTEDEDRRLAPVLAEAGNA